VLTFSIGIAAATFWLVSRREVHPAIETKVNHPQTIPTSKSITFEPQMNVDGYIKGAGRWFSIPYKSSDGVMVSYEGGEYLSEIRANKELRKKLKEAIRIIERGPKLNEKGQFAGERVIAMFPSTLQGKELSSVLWTDGSQLFSIDSLSLDHTLELEKSFNR
jgi:hypothetical protein